MTSATKPQWQDRADAMTDLVDQTSAKDVLDALLSALSRKRHAAADDRTAAQWDEMYNAVLTAWITAVTGGL